MLTTATYEPFTANITGLLAASSIDMDLVAALRCGDEAAFIALVEAYRAGMVRLALCHVASYAVAEEVIQETWLAVLQGLDRFAGRSSLKTWIFRILKNIAITHGQRESRSVPLSLLATEDGELDRPAVDRECFTLDGRWAEAPQGWESVPEERFLTNETQAYIRAAIAALPARQREVITLRDIEGWEADEVCQVLGISAANQRVLLHRARSSVRQTLAAYIGADIDTMRAVAQV